jgi:hypothetical protein
MDAFLSGFFVDPTTLAHDATGFIQLVILLAGYGYVISTASGLISDGSELLLLVPSIAGVVGSIVLPILGAVPDGAMILFSGLGPNASEQVKVGVGALAGSTIMLLTGTSNVYAMHDVYASIALCTPFPRGLTRCELTHTADCQICDRYGPTFSIHHNYHTVARAVLATYRVSL